MSVLKIIWAEPLQGSEPEFWSGHHDSVSFDVTIKTTYSDGTPASVTGVEVGLQVIYQGSIVASTSKSVDTGNDGTATTTLTISGLGQRLPSVQPGDLSRISATFRVFARYGDSQDQWDMPFVIVAKPQTSVKVFVDGGEVPDNGNVSASPDSTIRFVLVDLSGSDQNYYTPPGGYGSSKVDVSCIDLDTGGTVFTRSFNYPDGFGSGNFTTYTLLESRVYYLFGSSRNVECTVSWSWYTDAWFNAGNPASGSASKRFRMSIGGINVQLGVTSLTVYR